MKLPILALDHPDHNEWQSSSFESLLCSVADLTNTQERFIVLVANDTQQANDIATLMKSLLHESISLLRLPSWETLPYDHFSPHRDIISERMTTLSSLSQSTQGILITDIATALTRLVPKDYFNQEIFIAKIGDRLNPTALSESLTQAGYRHVSQVYEHGEYCIRGDIIDLFPMGSQCPIRLSLFDDEIESIKTFDTQTQLSQDSLESISCLPAEEYPLTENGIKTFRRQWRQHFIGNPRDSSMYETISDGRPTPGAEYYLPLFFEETNSLFDYLPDNSLIINTDKEKEYLGKTLTLIKRRHEQHSHDRHKPILKPEQCFLTEEQWFSEKKGYPKLTLSNSQKKQYSLSNSAQALPDLSKKTPRSHPFERLTEWLKKQSEVKKIILCAETQGRREILREHCLKQGWKPLDSVSLQSAYHHEAHCQLVISPLLKGFQVDQSNTLIISESDLLGYTPILSRKKRRDNPFSEEQLIRDLSELKIGDVLCHREHGLCSYQGLDVITTGDFEQEYMRLIFDNDDKLYLPITNLHMIGRYIAPTEQNVQLSRLGSKKWDKQKEQAKKKVSDIAASLLDIYAQRELAKRPPSQLPSDDFKMFKDEFPFQETDDQSSCIEAIIKDMGAEKSMDRLLCGDVGFGKTEVAMQAAFHAVQQGRQVVFLAPTTLLASQHHASCVDRFANWPVRIVLLTRGVTGKAFTEIKTGLEKGSIDLVVATHKILSGDIQFKELGLLIVDEEHRFGVAQKEKIKALKACVDMLAMTATPIPRTLNMSLSKLRDLSIMATPPARRLAVKTFVEPYDMAIIEEAILREYNRGGQVFFLHNDIATMSAIAEKIESTLPQIKTQIAHGQMTEPQLEKIMADFQHQQFHVLIATTIIESGIDIPNANTIIINNADKFGLAQLHQCRGRVGRSHHQAYAYLLVDRHKTLTKDAQARLKAIAEHSDLGAGFQLAMQDLEIRGAGELLGKEQSGQMEAIGYGLYLEMLQEAIALQQGKSEDKKKHTQIDIDLGVSTLFPQTYIRDVSTRLALYKELSDLNTEESIQTFKAHTIDRFGPLPDEAEQLLKSHRFQLLLAPMGIIKLRMNDKHASIQFNNDPKIKVETLFELLQKKPLTYQLINKTKLKVNFKQEISFDERYAKIEETLLRLK